VKSGAERDPLDRYFTPLPFSRAHVRRLIEVGLLKSGSVVIDAGCGDGSYLEAIDIECSIAGLSSVKAFGIDLDEENVKTCLGKKKKAIHGSFLEIEGLKMGQIDLVTGNPPFAFARPFVDHGLVLAKQNVSKVGAVSFLLQSQWLSGADRFESGTWKGLVRCDPFTTRPKFYGPAVDLINKRRASEGKGKAGGNTVDYSAFTWTTDRLEQSLRDNKPHDVLARHIEPVREPVATASPVCDCGPLASDRAHRGSCPVAEASRIADAAALGRAMAGYTS
jgi:predicted RNA methylase